MSTNIPYHFHIDILNIKDFRRGVLFVWPLVYRDVQILVIRQTTTIRKNNFEERYIQFLFTVLPKRGL